MLLKFYAKPEMLTAWPNSHIGGQARRYIGRDFDSIARTYSASETPAQVEETDEDARHMLRKCSRGELWAADKYTAEKAGVDFIALQRGTDGEWFPKPVSPPRLAPSSSATP